MGPHQIARVNPRVSEMENSLGLLGDELHLGRQIVVTQDLGEVKSVLQDFGERIRGLWTEVLRLGEELETKWANSPGNNTK